MNRKILFLLLLLFVNGEVVSQNLVIRRSPSADWISVSEGESNRIERKAKVISKNERAFDQIVHKEFAYFSSKEKEDMLIHSNQYLGGGNNFGWVVLEKINKDGIPEVIFEDYGEFVDGCFIDLFGSIILERKTRGTDYVETVLYKWTRDKVLEQIMRYPSSGFNYQSPTPFLTYWIADFKTQQLYIVNSKQNKYTVDLYKLIDGHYEKASSLLLSDSIKSNLMGMDKGFETWLLENTTFINEH